MSGICYLTMKSSDSANWPSQTLNLGILIVSRQHVCRWCTHPTGQNGGTL